MICSKKDLHRFIVNDANSMGININSKFSALKSNILNPRWKFIKLLRTCEYYSNNKNSFINALWYQIYLFRYKRLGLKLGFSIPLNVFDEGLSLPHYGTIIVSKNAKIGKNCRVHACVNIGASGGDPRAPQIGDNVYIGPGAKLFGNISIEEGCTIGANAVVNKSVEIPNSIIGGVPAKVLKISSGNWWEKNGLTLKSVENENMVLVN
ncbi:serine O-acetyltransferase [Echinicola sp. 20G]|uniref:serine O-acetyltransferase n=1 Tax=Echinicola sp. 20G TaxID=2781961 RepID=UPI00190FD1FA|nr:serine acetyltransferase [Echinicola sp. 20G]